ncbi:hypothetical protein BO78DRAFT_382174 [Aspergillus sclerotiicarbonarius CBS 121057]|uniref:Uncharacterized protein n=1 Tax=Aspergillus sclerotiicarbonarius (strain CBS 121057 / IBT 28362) TaxID=1448318 RepID=A0A319EW36_ASPSB|nr:hypothetical protein BO78DRAFT_382174 [Aspergillus sclerotiicarbonarius CBS 121057]
MSEYKYVGQEASKELISDIVQLLEDNQVASLLIGTFMRGLLYQPVEPNPIDLVIDNKLITGDDGCMENSLDRAVRILHGAGFPDGLEYNTPGLKCPAVMERRNATREFLFGPRFKPYHSFHLQGETQGGMHQELRLYSKSDYFWAVPDFKLGPLDRSDHPDFILANDSRCLEGPGRFPEGPCRVKIPSPVRYIEAMLLLMIRHGETEDSQNFWRTEILILQINVNPWPFKDEDFHPRVQYWWKAAKDFKEHFIDHAQWRKETPHISELHRALQQEGTLKAPGFPDLYLPS